MTVREYEHGDVGVADKREFHSSDNGSIHRCTGAVTHTVSFQAFYAGDDTTILVACSLDLDLGSSFC